MTADSIVAATAAWLATWLVHSSAALGAAWCVDRLRRPSLAVKELAWRVALGVPLLSATLQLAFGVAPAWARLVPASAARGLSAAARASVPDTTPLLRALGDPALPAVLVLAWAAVAAAGLARLAHAWLRLRRGTPDLRPPSPDETARLLRLTRGQPAARIRVSDALAMPLAVGREIRLPTRALRELPDAQLRCVLWHEAAHVRRRDPAWRLAAAVVQRALFLQPLVHSACRRLRELAECLCDDAAVGATGRPLDLAAALASVAAWSLCPPPNAWAAEFTRRESLGIRRVRRLLDPRHAAARPLPRWAPALAGGCACAAFTLLVPAPREPFARADLPVYTVAASDPAGPFTVVLRGGRVTAAAFDGRAVPRENIVQRGDAVRLEDPRGGTLTLRLNGAGGFAWYPRKPAAAAPALPPHP
ncbi:MAG: M56 family metallopeptidase [Longimicrobiaceae bacterium]